MPANPSRKPQFDQRFLKDFKNSQVREFY